MQQAIEAGQEFLAKLRAAGCSTQVKPAPLFDAACCLLTAVFSCVRVCSKAQLVEKMLAGMALEGEVLVVILLRGCCPHHQTDSQASELQAARAALRQERQVAYAQRPPVI